MTCCVWSLEMKRPYFCVHDCYVLPASLVKELPVGSNDDDVEIVVPVALEACWTCCIA